jgi:tight adherence protein B
MTLLAGLAVGVFVYFLVGYATGYTPEIKIRRFRRRSQISNRQLWLNQAGVAVTPRQFIAGSVAVAAVAFVAIVVVTGAPLVALVPAAGVAALPRAYFARRRTAHLQRVQAAWPDGLRDVIASIAAGRSLSQALNALAASGPVPLQEAFTRFPMLSRMLGTVPALEVIKEELADPTSDRVIEVLVIAHERGGQIVRDILEDLVAATTRDLKLLEEVETEGLEMKINARAVLVLPWLVLVALTIREGPFRDFYRSTGGLVVVLIAGLLSVAGGFFIARLASTRAEQRVFGSSAAVATRERA